MQADELQPLIPETPAWDTGSDSDGYVPETPLTTRMPRRAGFDSSNSTDSMRTIDTGIGIGLDMEEVDHHDGSDVLNSSISYTGPDRHEWVDTVLLEPPQPVDPQETFREFDRDQLKQLAGIGWQLRMLAQLFSSTAQHAYLEATNDLLVSVEAFSRQRGKQQRAAITKSMATLRARLVNASDKGHVSGCVVALIDQMKNNWSAIFPLSDTEEVPADDPRMLAITFLEGLVPMLASTKDQVGGIRLVGAMLKRLKAGMVAPDFPAMMNAFDQLTDRLEKLPAITDSHGVPIKTIRAHIWFAKQVFSLLNAQSLERADPPDDPAPVDQSTMPQFINLLEAIRIPMQGSDSRATQTLTDLINYLKNPRAANGTEKPDTLEKQWAIASLRVQQVLEGLEQQRRQPKYQDDAVWNGVKLGFLKENLAHLTKLSGTRWMEQAHAQVVSDLTDYYRIAWGFAYTSSDKLSVFGGIGLNGVLPGMPELVKGPYARIGFSHTRATMLDDENFPAKMITTGITGAGGADLGLVSAGGQGSYEAGTYEEWDNPNGYVLSNLPKLLGQHASCKPHLNRYTSAGIAEPWFGPARSDVFQLARHHELRTQFNLNNANMSQSLSTLLSIVGKDMRPFAPDNVADMPAQVGDQDRPVNIAPIETAMGNSIVLTYGSETGSIVGTVGIDQPLVKAAASSSVTVSSAHLNMVRKTSICAKLRALESEMAERQDVLDDFEEDRNTKDNIEKIKEQIARHSQHFVTSMGANQYERDCDAVRHTPMAMLDRQQPPAARLRELRKYFAEYTRFQMAYARAKSAAEKATINAMINGFHAMFGAPDREYFLYALVLLNADLYVQAVPGDPDLLREEILKFETQLVNPPFPVNREALDRLATYGRTVDLAKNEVRISVSTYVGVAYWLPISKLCKAQVEVTLVRSERDHPKSLRHATNYEIEIQLPRWKILCTKKELVDDIVKSLSNTEEALEIPDLRQAIFDNLDMSVDGGQQSVLTLRWSKPKLFPVGLLPMYSRVNTTTNLSAAPSFGVGGGATVGAGYDKVENRFYGERYSSKAIWYSLIRFAHDQGQKWITRDGDQIHASSAGYWSEITRNHRPEFEQLFMNAADGLLERELDGLEATFKSRGLTAAQRSELEDVRADFEHAASEYTNNRLTYAACLRSYEHLLFVLSIHAAKMTAQSSLYGDQDKEYALQPAWHLRVPHAHTVAVPQKSASRPPRIVTPAHLSSLHSRDARSGSDSI